VPVRQWVLSLPIPLRLLLAAQPKLVTPVLQVVHRVITRHLLGQAGLKADEADSGAVTLIQRFGSAANLNIHLRQIKLRPLLCSVTHGTRWSTSANSACCFAGGSDKRRLETRHTKPLAQRHRRFA